MRTILCGIVGIEACKILGPRVELFVPVDPLQNVGERYALCDALERIMAATPGA